MVLDWKKVDYPRWVGSQSLPKAEDFKYLGVLFTRDSRMDEDMDKWIGASSALMWMLLQSYVAKRAESKHKALDSLVHLRCKPLCIKRSRLKRFGHLARMPPGCFNWEVFWACPTRKRPQGKPRTCWRDYISHLAWESLGMPQNELEDATGERDVWGSLLDRLPRDPISDKGKTMAAL